MKIKIGKSHDGLVGNPNNKKPRYYAVIWMKGRYIAVVKVYTTDSTNAKDAEKLEKKIRKMIRNFSPDSAIDKRVYTQKKSGSLIKDTDLNYDATNNFVFDEKQSASIFEFIIDDPNNVTELMKFLTKKTKGYS